MSILIAVVAGFMIGLITVCLFKLIKPKNNSNWLMLIIYVVFGIVIGFIFSKLNDTINIGILEYLAIAITPCIVLFFDEIRERKNK